MDFKPETKAKIQALFGKYPTKQAALLPTLHLAQEEFGHIAPSVKALVAKELEIPLADVDEVVSFYTMFYERPIGKYHFQVCHNLTCSLLGAESLLVHLERRLGIKCGQTSADGRYSLMRVECLAACDGGPMLQLNDRFLTDLTVEKLDQIIKELP